MCPSFPLTYCMDAEFYIIWPGVPLRKCWLFFFCLFTFYHHWASCKLISHCRTRLFRKVIDDSSYHPWQILIPTRNLASIMCLKYSVVPWWFSIPNLCSTISIWSGKNLSFWKDAMISILFEYQQAQKNLTVKATLCHIFPN